MSRVLKIIFGILIIITISELGYYIYSIKRTGSSSRNKQDIANTSIISPTLQEKPDILSQIPENSTIDKRNIKEFMSWKTSLYKNVIVDVYIEGTVRILYDKRPLNLEGCDDTGFHYTILIENENSKDNFLYPVCGGTEKVLKIYANKNGNKVPLTIKDIGDGSSVRFYFRKSATRYFDESPQLALELEKL
jgi:hypothetical protein